MAENFDAIVVGAGPTGNAAAYTRAKAGLKVLQIERGEYPGSKNVQGAILYAQALEQIIPDFRDDAPLERHIVEQRMWMLDDNSFVGTHYRSADYNKPPYNRYTIFRAQFDQWCSSQVRGAGGAAREKFDVDRASGDGRECFRRCHRSRQRFESQLECGLDHAAIGIGRNDQLAARVGDLANLSRRQHGSSSDQRVGTELLREALDADEGLRRVERHFDRANAGVEQRARHVDDFIGTHAAENRNDCGRAGIQKVRQLHRDLPALAAR